jgi:hypothetical protein
LYKFVSILSLFSYLRIIYLKINSSTSPIYLRSVWLNSQVFQFVYTPIICDTVKLMRLVFHCDIVIMCDWCLYVIYLFIYLFINESDVSLSLLVRVWDGEMVKGVDAQTLFQLKGGSVTSVCERLVYFSF